MSQYIYGAGGHGKVVLDAMRMSELKCYGFIDVKSIDKCAGLPVFKPDILTNKSNQNIRVHIAIGDRDLREKISKELNKISFFSVFHPTAVISNTAKIDAGSFLAAGSIVSVDASIGKHTIINHSAVVDHDCSVGDLCHIAPHACLGGDVKVGRGVFVGAGAIVLPGVLIGDFATIGAGAIVTKNVGMGITVVGNPARPLI